MACNLPESEIKALKELTISEFAEKAGVKKFDLADDDNFSCSQINEIVYSDLGKQLGFNDDYDLFDFLGYDWKDIGSGNDMLVWRVDDALEIIDL